MTEWIVRKGSYVFDRRLFIGCIVLLSLIVVVAFVQLGTGTHYYVNCPDDSFSPCRNPYYTNDGFGDFCITNNAELCSLPRTLYPGQSFGEKPPFIITNFYWISILIVGAAFVANHYLYNNGGHEWRK